MEKVEHGLRLKRAMAGRGLRRADVATVIGVKERTVTNWTSGFSWPDLVDRENLRKLFPGYDVEGDGVEAALKISELTEDRQHEVLSVYKRVLRQQREDDPKLRREHGSVDPNGR